MLSTVTLLGYMYSEFYWRFQHQAGALDKSPEYHSNKLSPAIHLVWLALGARDISSWLGIYIWVTFGQWVWQPRWSPLPRIGPLHAQAKNCNVTGFLRSFLVSTKTDTDTFCAWAEYQIWCFWSYNPFIKPACLMGLWPPAKITIGREVDTRTRTIR